MYHSFGFGWMDTLLPLAPAPGAALGSWLSHLASCLAALSSPAQEIARAVCLVGFGRSGSSSTVCLASPGSCSCLLLWSEKCTAWRAASDQRHSFQSVVEILQCVCRCSHRSGAAVWKSLGWARS